VQEASTAQTLNEHVKLEERRNVLRRRLNTWIEARNLYIPPTSEGHTSTTTPSTESPDTTSESHLPESVSLRLPSTLPVSLQQACPFKLTQIELRFRLSQAEDSLSELRRLLCITMNLRDYKVKQVGPSQCVGTRARNLVKRFQGKVSRCVERYRAAHNALLALCPIGEWQTHLRQLKDDNIRPPGRREDESEGSREVPWIWLVMRRCGLEQASSQEQSGPLSEEELDDSERMS
jgi:hypothetical protein